MMALGKSEALKCLGAFLCMASMAAASARQYDENTNLLEDPRSLATIDFSRAIPGPDGTVCVQRKKYVDKVEKDQLKECFVQNVTQCYYTYVTEYVDGLQEKCQDFYWKTCKIVFKERVFNATSRRCRRPLVKVCQDEAEAEAAGSGSAADKIVCETFFETECNTTKVVPSPGDEPLDVTFCDKIPRKICAADNCRVVEEAEVCQESYDESTIDHPEELCDLQPQKHCSQEKVAVPRLIPEQKCRQVEKEICNTQMVNPHQTHQTVFVKYCARPDGLIRASEPALQAVQPAQSHQLPVYVSRPRSSQQQTLAAQQPSSPPPAYAPSGGYQVPGGRTVRQQQFSSNPFQVVQAAEVPAQSSSGGSSNLGQAAPRTKREDHLDEQGYPIRPALDHSEPGSTS